MAGKKEFTGNQPRTGRQRSAEQVSARQTDLLNYINEIFCLTADANNFGKVIGIDATGELEAVDAVIFSGTALEDQVLAYNSVTELFEPENSVLGLDKNYKVGNDGAAGQLLVTDGNGNLTFQNPPSSVTFTDVTGDFTATPNVNYNIDGGAQITINSADVAAGDFAIKFRGKNGVDLEQTTATVLYNGVNPFENTTEDLIIDADLVYTLYSQDNVTLQISAECKSNTI